MYKELNKKGLDSANWLLWRNVGCLILLQFVLVPKQLNPIKVVTRDEMKWIVARCLFGQLGFCLLFYSMTLIPISILIVMLMTAPLWVSILNYFVNNERIFAIEYVAMASSFLGVIGIAVGKANQ